MLGDIFEFDWASDADLIFCNSTCFTPPMMEQIYQKALASKKGSWFLTMSKKLPHAETLTDINESAESEQIHWELIVAIRL